MKILLLCFILLFTGCISGSKIHENSTPKTIPSAEQINTENSEWIEYRIQTGDTLSSIARQFNVSIDSIIIYNDIRNARNIAVGDILKIPVTDGH